MNNEPVINEKLELLRKETSRLSAQQNVFSSILIAVLSTEQLQNIHKALLASHVSESRAPIIEALTSMASDVASEIETRLKKRPTRH
jgi:hypothetical protein